jgi:hypothetical protein
VSRPGFDMTIAAHGHQLQLRVVDTAVAGAISRGFTALVSMDVARQLTFMAAWRSPMKVTSMYWKMDSASFDNFSVVEDELSDSAYVEFSLEALAPQESIAQTAEHTDAQIARMAKQIEYGVAKALRPYVGRQMTGATKEQAVVQVMDHVVITGSISEDPLDVKYDDIPLRVLMERDRKLRTGEFNLRDSGMPHPSQHKPFTADQRAALSARWSAELRAKIEATRKADAVRDRLQVVFEGDPEDFPW